MQLVATFSFVLLLTMYKAKFFRKENVPSDNRKSPSYNSYGISKQRTFDSLFCFVNLRHKENLSYDLFCAAAMAEYAREKRAA